MRFIDLFGGIGGFRLGMEKHGHECVGYYDIDKYVTAVYNYNFGEQHEPNDITRIPSEEIPDHDILCGGFPCQAFSIAGKREGFEDITRGTLFFEILRILRDKRPKMVFLENVKGLLSHDAGRTFYTILNSLRELGYMGQYEVLNSKNFGVPQNRERVFIIGHLGEGSGRKIFSINRKKNGVLRMSHEIRGKTPSGLSHMNDWVFSVTGLSPTLTSSFNVESVKISYCIGSTYQQKNSPEDSLKRGSKQLIRHKKGIRMLTPIECERLQGFPDDWTTLGKFGDEVRPISDTQRYKMCGNAVTVNVIEAIVERITEGKKHPRPRLQVFKSRENKKRSRRRLC